MIYLTDCSVPIKSYIDYVVSLYQVRIQVVLFAWWQRLKNLTPRRETRYRTCWSRSTAEVTGELLGSNGWS